MDIRERIIQEITETLQAKVPGDVLDLVQDILIMELNQYEIQERCTEVDIPDTSAEGQLKRYIATKRLEGKPLLHCTGIMKRIRGCSVSSGNRSGTSRPMIFGSTCLYGDSREKQETGHWMECADVTAAFLPGWQRKG